MQHFARYHFSSTVLSLCLYKKSLIWETPNLSTNADRSTNNYFWKRKRRRKNRIRETPSLSTDAERNNNIYFWRKKNYKNLFWNNSPFLGLYESVDQCTSPPVNSCMQSGTTPRALRGPHSKRTRSRSMRHELSCLTKA